MEKIYVIYGNEPRIITEKLLKHTMPFADIDKKSVFGIKPNLVCASPAEEGATTHPQIVEGIICYLQSEGFANIKIMESSWVGDDTKRAYDVCGYTDLSYKYGVPLIDLKDDSYSVKEYDGVKVKICDEVLKTDYLINVPLIKGHCQTKISCALKNLKGLIPDSEKRRFHTMGLHKPISILNKIVKQNLIIADGICPDPYFEEGGRPHEMNMVVLSYDPVLTDVFAAELLGYKKEDISYIMLSEKIGVGSTGPYETVEIESYGKKSRMFLQPDQKYLNMINEAGACSACYSNLSSALRKLEEEGLTENIVNNICIGQGYRDYPGEIGIGNCTMACKFNIPGCPPDTDDIYLFLKKVLNSD